MVGWSFAASRISLAALLKEEDALLLWRDSGDCSGRCDGVDELSLRMRGLRGVLRLARRGERLL